MPKHSLTTACFERCSKGRIPMISSMPVRGSEWMNHVMNGRTYQTSSDYDRVTCGRNVISGELIFLWDPQVQSVMSRNKCPTTKLFWIPVTVRQLGLGTWRHIVKTLSHSSNNMFETMFVLSDNLLPRRVIGLRTHVSFVFLDQVAQLFPQCGISFSLISCPMFF